MLTGTFSGNPFNQSQHFHSCATDCHSSDCNIDNWNDPTEVRAAVRSGLKAGGEVHVKGG